MADVNSYGCFIMLSSLVFALYLISLHSSEVGPGHLADTSSATRRLLDRMGSSSQVGRVSNSLFSNNTLCSWSSSRLLFQGSLDMDELSFWVASVRLPIEWMSVLRW